MIVVGNAVAVSVIVTETVMVDVVSLVLAGRFVCGAGVKKIVVVSTEGWLAGAGLPEAATAVTVTVSG